MDDLQSALALNGGTPIRNTPWPERGLIGLEEKAAVDALFDEAIASGQAIGYGGPQEDAYCAEFAQHLGGGWADGVSSGTAGVYVALKALELPPYSEVIVGAVTDPGGIMPIPLLNLIPVVADTAPDSFNVGPDQIAARITPLTSAVVVPHIHGEPADMPGIMQVAQAHGLKVVEDCSQSHGSRLNGQLVGTFGDIAAFSTMFGKHHCTGGQGGLVYTKQEELYWRIRRASDRGKPFGLDEGATNHVAALNMNLNELAAAIGRIQLAKLPDLVTRRRASALAVIDGISTLATVTAPDYVAGAEPSYWFLKLQFVPEQATCDKETYCAALAAEGLPIMASYRAALPYKMDWFVNRRVFGDSTLPWSSPEYTGSAGTTFECPNVESAMDRHFMISIHANWSAAEVADAVAALSKVDAAFAR